MTIKLEEELISEEGEKLDISKQYVVVRNEGNTTIIKESGRGKRNEYTVKTWKLAKVCESVKSSRGGILSKEVSRGTNRGGGVCPRRGAGGCA